MLTPETYAAAAAAAPAASPGRPRRRRRWRGCSRPTRRSRPSAASSTSRTSCCSRRASSRSTPTSPRAVRAQYRHFVVDEYQDVNRPPAAPARPLARRPRRPVRRRRPQPDDLLVHRGHARTTCWASRARFPRPRSSRWCATTGRRRRSSAWPTALLGRGAPAGPRAAGAGRAASRSGRPVPSPALTAVRRRRRPRPRPSPRASPTCSPAGVPAGEIAVLFRTNAPVRGRSSRRWPSAGVPYLRARRRAVLRTAARCARRSCCCAGAARSDDGSVPLRASWSATCSPAPGWTREPPSAGGAVRERWESLQALAALADDLAAARPGRAAWPTSSRELDERAAAQHAPAVEGVTLASLHAAKGLEWDAVFLVGCSARACCRSRWPTTGRRSRRSAGCSTSASPGPASTCSCRGRGPATPGGRASRRPSRFLDGLPRRRRRAPPAAAARRAGARRGRRHARAGGRCRRTAAAAAAAVAPPRSARSAAAPTARPTTTRQLFERLREWRLGDGRERRACRPTSCSPTRRSTAIAELLPADQAALARIPGVGPAKLERYGEAVLALLSD